MRPSPASCPDGWVAPVWSACKGSATGTMTSLTRGSASRMLTGRGRACCRGTTTRSRARMLRAPPPGMRLRRRPSPSNTVASRCRSIAAKSGHRTCVLADERTGELDLKARMLAPGPPPKRHTALRADESPCRLSLRERPGHRRGTTPLAAGMLAVHLTVAGLPVDRRTGCRRPVAARTPCPRRRRRLHLSALLNLLGAVRHAELGPALTRNTSVRVPHPPVDEDGGRAELTRPARFASARNWRSRSAARLASIEEPVATPPGEDARRRTHAAMERLLSG